MTKLKITLISTFVLVLLGACGTRAMHEESGLNPPERSTAQEDATVVRSLNVTGIGTVNLSPDIAYVTLGVRTEDSDAAQAVADNNKRSTDLTEALEDFGIAPEDIQTSNFNIYSWEDYNEFSENGAPGTIYSVENNVHVTLRDVDTFGELLSAAVDAGANNIWGVQFDVEDRSAAVSLSRELAVDNANAQAQELADLADVELGEILTISTQGGGFPAPSYTQGGGDDAVAFDEALSVPVSPGQLTITTQISIVFEIK